MYPPCVPALLKSWPLNMCQLRVIPAADAVGNQPMRIEYGQVTQISSGVCPPWSPFRCASCREPVRERWEIWASMSLFVWHRGVQGAGCQSIYLLALPIQNLCRCWKNKYNKYILYNTISLLCLPKWGLLLNNV